MSLSARRPLRILSNDYDGNVGSKGVVRGGTEVFARELSSRLGADGHHWIGVISQRDVAFGTVTTVVRTHATYVRAGFGPIATKVRDVVGRRDPVCVFRAEIDFAKELIAKHAPDVVFLNGFYALPWILFEAAIELRIPTVVQHAGIWAKEIRAYADMYSPDARRMAYRMERRSAQKADSNVFLNETSCDAFKSALRIDTIAGETIIPLPHPGWRFASRVGMRRADATEHVTLGCVARWDRIKNHEAILSLAQAAHELGYRWTIRVVTDIPESAINTGFKKQYRATVDVVAPMGRTELARFYESLDAVLVPSHFETGPFIVLEAAARGVPTVIAPGVGWASEYRAHGMHDWILDFERPYAAARRLRHLLETMDTNTTTKFAKWIEIGHSPDTIYQSYLRLFRRVVSR